MSGSENEAGITQDNRGDNNTNIGRVEGDVVLDQSSTHVYTGTAPPDGRIITVIETAISAVIAFLLAFVVGPFANRERWVQVLAAIITLVGLMIAVRTLRAERDKWWLKKPMWLAIGLVVGSGVLLGLSPEATEPLQPLPAGDNIAVFALTAASDDRQQDAKDFSSALASGLDEALEAGWKVWGPSDLAEAGLADLPLDDGDLEQRLTDLNIDVAMYGTLAGVRPSSVIDMKAWFTSSAPGILESGLAGEVELASTQSAAGISNIAEDLRQQATGWVPLLQGFSKLRGAGPKDLDAVLTLFESALDTNGESDGLTDFAKLAVARIHIFGHATLGPDALETTRARPLLDALPLFEEVANSANTEAKARALIGQAQTNMLLRGCHPEVLFAPFADTGIPAAEDALQHAQSIVQSASPGPHELTFRLQAMEAALADCRRQISPADSAMATSADGAIGGVIETFESHEHPERVAFTAAEFYGRRGRSEAERAGSDDAVMSAALDDLARASCWSRPFSSPFWNSVLAQYGHTANCDADPFAEPES